MATNKRKRSRLEEQPDEDVAHDSEAAAKPRTKQSTHIRFEEGREVKEECRDGPSVPKSKRQAKRRGRGSTSASSSSSSPASSFSSRSTKPLNGLLLSVSTISDAASPPPTTGETTSFRSVADLCEALGARVSSQVHARVFAVVATGSAVDRSTQRIRKALRKSIPVVDVKWLQDCRRQRQRLEWTPYLCTERAKEAAELLEQRRSDAKDVLSDHELYRETEPIPLDCCCLCHDEDSPLQEDECEWCTSCNVNLENVKPLPTLPTRKTT